MTKEAFLLDGLEYYSVDPGKRRCLNSTIAVGSNRCKYSPKSIDLSTSEGCMIGRKLEPALALEWDKIYNAMGIISIPEKTIPCWMLSLGRLFLSSCQDLHDCSGNWTETGLSSEGAQKLFHLIKDHHLDITQFQKFLQ